MGIFSALRPLIAGARIAAENPRVQREAAVAARYASSRLAGQGERALLKAGQFLGSGGRRIARVYESPGGQMAMQAAFFAPMFLPMGSSGTETGSEANGSYYAGQSTSTDFSSQLPYQSLPPQLYDNYDLTSAGYLHQPSALPDMMPDIPSGNYGMTSADVMNFINQDDLNRKAKYQQMSGVANPWS